MSSIKVKFTGFLIITTTLFLFFSSIFLLGIEYLGVSKYFLSKIRENFGINPISLVDVGYYSNEEITTDPYSAYTVQHLHPYFMFSLPWRTEDRVQITNSVVSVNSDGFRNNPNNVDKTRKSAILLGGSTAFGHFSSSDEATIASVLSKTLKINVVNRNAPSWNSHQELVALAKYTDKYNFSISFTLANDISVACYENNRWDDGLAYLDAPESYSTLQGKINNIRGKISLKFSIKGIAKSIFPDTYGLLRLIKYYYFTDKEQAMRDLHNSFCSKVKPNDIALSFLRNQNVMNQISSARNAVHILALQPHVALFDRNAKDHKIRNSVYDNVMNSEYCATNICIDMRKTKRPVTVDALYNGKNISSAIFVDKVHLTDRGVFMYSQIIAEKISKF